MTERITSPESGAPRKTSPLQKTAQLVAAAVASVSLAHAEPTPTTSSTSAASQTAEQVDPLATYTIQVANMTEEELRAESDALAEIIQPLIDANAPEAEVRPSLLKYDIVSQRLDPIIQKKTEEARQVSKEAKQATQEMQRDIAEIQKDTKEMQQASKEMQQASKLLEDIQQQLETPEKIDPDSLLKKLHKALEIHKKYNPELYASNN